MTNSLTASQNQLISGSPTIPGDKSISHRSLMFGGLAIGETVICDLLEGEDVIRTADAMRAMGASIEKDENNNIWRCHGVGIGGLQEPAQVLDMGNSGTSTRLLMGLIGGHHITAQLTGDASLTKRPMNRVIKPLEQMGVEITAREGGRLPLSISGPQDTLSIEYKLPVASAQVKSAILLAGLSAMGKTTVIEEKPTRDHTENMLRHFGVPVDVHQRDGVYHISVTGQQDLKGTTVHVPSDPSSAAFPCVAALLTPGSELTMANILMNERRSGVYDCLIEMGADITFTNERIEAGEKVADLVVRGGASLKAIDVPENRVPSMIDEFPILAMAAACAEGTTRMTGLEELRVKESDRLLVVYNGLKACGVNIEKGEDWLIIYGTGDAPKGGVTIETALDHRIAMSFLILGGVSQEPIMVDDGAPILTSFPNFVALMNDLGAKIR